ncbi:MAG: acetyltransferase, partial [Mycobacterium sp.]|nr:acetyltransferase [Mycobacterium sp.]
MSGRAAARRSDRRRTTYTRSAERLGKLVSARISPLRLEAFEQLPKHARQCVFWEVDPETVEGEDHLADPEFEKEAWLSMVMLEWGSCGQVATRAPADTDDDSELPCLGYVLYAPPHAVPRAL